MEATKTIDQLEAIMQLLKTFGYETKDLTIEEVFAIKSGLKEVLETSEVLNK